MSNERLKGGVGGASTRMRERIKVETPSADSIAKHAIFYSDRDLHRGNVELVPTPESLFGNTKPLHLDLGCGRGEYIVAMAEECPDRNFVGVDFHKKSLYFGINAAVKKNYQMLNLLELIFEI
jgi:tRNA (guanine-N7-)-methyltransferase